MSLSSLLENGDVKEIFRREFPKPKIALNQPLLAEPLTKNYSIVGTAFDYLQRFYMERLNPGAVTKQWEARSAFPSIIGTAEAKNDYKLLEKAEKLIADADKNYRSFLKTGQIHDNLIISAIALAYLDAISRAGPRVYDAAFTWIKSGRIDDNDVRDLRNLIALIKPELFIAHRLCLLNPTFNYASSFVRGADADIVIDNCIIEVKTTKNLRLEQSYFHQLIGYYTLYRIAGITGIDEKHEITDVAIYFSRHAFLLEINLLKMINEQSFPDFLNEFVDRAEREFKVLKTLYEKNATTESINHLPPVLRNYSSRFRS